MNKRIRYYILNKKTGEDSVPFKNRRELLKFHSTLLNKYDCQIEKRFEVEKDGKWKINWDEWGHEAVKIFDNANNLRGN